jgi:hypothetical protein
MQLGLHYTTCGYQQQSALQFSKLKCPPTDASYMSPPFCIVNTITPSAYFTFAAPAVAALPKPEPQIRFDYF